MSGPLYRLSGVTRRVDAHNGNRSLGGRTILDIETLSVPRGEVFAVVGPSGAGKSTFLRLLNFLEPPSSGSIEFDGEVFDAAHPPPLEVRRRVTTVFQRPVLLHRTVAQNVTYGLRLRSDRSSAHRVEEALAEVGLSALANQPARTLSGGEAQRVALARAMILRPAALLLDEPTANLDPYNVGMIEQIVRRLNGEHGTTCVLVTHNVFQAQRLAHRVALLLEGRVVETASNEAFFNRPTDPRTSAFVRGEMVY